VERVARMNRIGIPVSFATATLATYLVTGPGTLQALSWSQRYVEEFIPGTTRQGLLFTGSVGVGKTHLAIGIVRQLVEDKGIEARMVDMRVLLEQLRTSYDKRDQDQESQSQILRPIFKADVILIDELGAAKPSEWVLETGELLIGTAYNQAKPMIVTTNFPNLAPGDEGTQYLRSTRPETLGDRIGMRMWSRLQQMCKAIGITGPDWRKKG
jgi:DNA replication protein DnaC